MSSQSPRGRPRSGSVNAEGPSLPESETVHASDLAAGRAALVERRWADAIGHLEAAGEIQPLGGADLDGPGEASWCWAISAMPSPIAGHVPPAN